jgi:hypothetical protein
MSSGEGKKFSDQAAQIEAFMRNLADAGQKNPPTYCAVTMNVSSGTFSRWHSGEKPLSFERRQQLEQIVAQRLAALRTGQLVGTSSAPAPADRPSSDQGRFSQLPIYVREMFNLSEQTYMTMNPEARRDLITMMRLSVGRSVEEMQEALNRDPSSKPATPNVASDSLQPTHDPPEESEDDGPPEDAEEG